MKYFNKKFKFVSKKHLNFLKKKKKFNKQNKLNKLKYFLLKLIVLIILSLSFKILSIISLNTKFFFKENIKSLSYNEKIKKYSTYNKTEIIDDYLASIPSKFDKIKEAERKDLESFLSRKILTEYANETSDIEAKTRLLRHFTGMSSGKNFSNITLYVLDKIRFGNNLVMLNNLIYYCEVLGFKNIYLNSDHDWFLKDKIVTDKLNITMMPHNQVNCNSRYILCFKFYSGPGSFLLYQGGIKPEVRIQVIKDEINRNLPYVNINPSDLYIHMRTGDIFRRTTPNGYAQPPLCFYRKILNEFKFNKVYIIAEINNNPIINILIKEYPNVIYNKNQLSLDLSYLAHAYNLVASVSSFFLCVAKLNVNLKKYWEYDIYRKSEKFRHLHHDFYYFPINYIIYRMKPSTTYKNEMFPMTCDPSQIKLMINEICIYDFTIIKPNVK